jgi:cytochrome c-type biogenesis protein CcmH/NrfG
MDHDSVGPLEISRTAAWGRLSGLAVIRTFALVGLLVAVPVRVSAAGPTVAKTAAGLLKQGDPDSALVLVRRALRTDSTNAELWLALGEVQRARGRMAACVAALQRAVQLRPKLVTAWVGLADAYLESGPIDSAAVYAAAALANGSGRSPEAFYAVGRVFEVRGVADSAIIYYRWALSLMPGKRLF